MLRNRIRRMLCVTLCFVLAAMGLSINVLADVGAKKQTCIVWFDAYGGVVKVSNKTVTFGSAYGSLPEPTREHYDFTGWYTFKIGGVKITEDSRVSRNLSHVLYAHWKGKETEVTLDTDGGVVENETIIIRYGSKYSLPTPTKTNYLFEGWYTEKDGGKRITNNSIFTEQSNHVVYAHWQEKVLTIAFVSFNGEETIYKDVVCGKKYGKLPKPKKEGYKFNGWYTWEDYTDPDAKPIASDTIVSEYDKLELFARWM